MPESISPAIAAPLGAAVPTRIRYHVLALVCGLSMITYLDRVCFGAAAPALAKELNLANVAELKWVFTAFFVAYALFEIPAGWWGDRLGPRAMLIRIVAWWSVCTALTGVIGWQWGGITFGGLGTLIVLRFLFGAGEAGAYPNITRVIHNWFPKSQWETAQGFVWMSGRLAGGLTPLIWAILVTGTTLSAPLVHWRGAFFLFGAIGLVWCAVFSLRFRNRPSEHPGVNSEELEEIGLIRPDQAAAHSAVPWRAMLSNRSLLALCLMYSLINYGWAFNITYLPSFLEQRFDVSSQDLLGAIYKGAPLWVGAIGCVCGGWLVNLFSQQFGSRALGRRAVGVLALSACAVCWFVAWSSSNVHLFCVSVSLAAFCIDLTLGASWATCQDLGRQHVAVVAACMNMIGTLGAALAGWMTGTIVQLSISRQAALDSVAVTDLSAAAQHQAAMGGYQAAFAIYVAVYVAAAACWFGIDPNRPIEPLDRNPASDL